MQPNKYRGRLTPNTVNSCGSQLVFHPPVLEKNKQYEFKLSKEQPTLYYRIFLHDLEKNSAVRQGDARLSSPLVRTRQTPSAATVVEMFATELKHGLDSLPLGASGEINPITSVKSRSRSASHRSVLNVSKNQGDICFGKGDHTSCYIRGKKGGFPVVQRSAEEKIANPDLLNLERQNLAACPVIEGEEQLRLLNLQHNFITQMQNLGNLRRLIFLDLFNNQIEEIGGISSLFSLRVLMLGSNRIKKISNLESLENLDILDLHGNQITKIENVSHLSELRVLNLARNSINQVENLSGLKSLVELNLRNNQINYVRDVDTLPNLQRLHLSFNSISCFEDILCLADSSSIADVTLDGNPIAQEPWYKQTILGHMLQLRQLDMKRITEEERRTASLLARREEEKKRESHKQALLKEKKRLAIYNAARQWEKQQNRVVHIPGSKHDQKDYDSTSHKPCPIDGNAHAVSEENRSLDTVLNSALQGLSVIDSHFVELEGDTLYLYGSGALESLERSWSLQSSGTVTTLFFTFIDFDEIVQVLPKVKMKFPNASHLKFKETNLAMFQQFNALAQVRRLDQLTVDPQGNPVVNFTLWKYYVLFRLSHFNLQKINGTEITSNDLVMAEKLFGILSYVASSDLPQFRLLSLLGESRKKNFNPFLEGKAKKSGVTTEESNDSRRVGGERANRAILNYTIKDLQTERLEEIKEKNKFCHAYVLDLVKEASDISLKNETLQKLWPQMFIELVRDAVIEVHNKNSYMKLCLQRIIDQK